MIETLKFVHFFAIALVVGGGFASLLIGVWTKDTSGPVKATVGQIQARLARLGFVSVIALWLSGLGLMHLNYGGLGAVWPMLWLKLALVTLLTVLSTGVQAVRVGLLPAALIAAPARRKAISYTASGLTVMILACASLAFS